MSIVAALDKVLFFNASSKYSVLRMKTEDSSVPAEARSPYRYHDHLIRFTAVGIELPQTDTVKIEMDGEWKDGKYGLQLQVDHWQEIVPPTLEGVRNYLASGLLKGIGEKTADAIIEKFGINALEILEHQPDRLLEIRGITKERLAEIKDAYAETSRMRVLMTLLAPFKVTPTTAQKIYQHFGPSCADIVRQSPFNLCQVPGFGFKRIDAIVQKSGGDLRDPKRVHGALFYALEDARTKDGHLYLEAEALLKAAMQLLNERIPLPQMRVPMSQVEQELSAMIRQDEVVSNHGNVYLPKQFLQESETAQKAVELFLAKPTVVDIAQPLERVKHSLGLNLSKRQSEGVEMVFRHNLSIITGGPGTGKTTVLKTVIEVYRQLYPQQKIVLGAPTGKASRRMAEATGIDEAQTLHSILGLHGDSESKKDRERKPLEAGLLIVDETSMVDMWLIHQLFSRLRPGTKVLLVGDADQLESVGAGDVFHELIGSGVVPVTVLDEIFRQAQDSLIAHNCETRKLRKFVHFASPKAMNIMGLSESILEKFIGKGWLHSYMDIFALDKHRAEIVQMEGFGEKSWQNLWDAIQHSRITTFEQYLTAMDIPMVGSTASKAICQRFRGNLAEFETAVCQSFDFTQLPDFGETLHRNIHQWFRSEENWTIWTELRRLVCIKTYQPPAASTDMSNPFVGKTLVVTGKVEPYTRDGINEKIESLGAHAGSSVSSKTDYLICGENAGSKLAKAQELGIKILSPDEFFRMAGESA